MTLTVLSPPGEEPVSLSAAKAFLRIAHTGEDDLVGNLIAGARSQIEQAAGLALVERTLRRTYSSWPRSIRRRGVRLTPGPAKMLLAVRVVEADGVETDYTGHFQIDDGRICLRPWRLAPPVPIGGHIEVDFVAGFGLQAQVPEDLVLAVKRMTQMAYDLRALPDRRQRDDGLPEDVRAILNARQGARL
ncbi:MAG: phage head-tail connector protein [Pseudomonadota bacterium]